MPDGEEAGKPSSPDCIPASSIQSGEEAALWLHFSIRHSPSFSSYKCSHKAFLSRCIGLCLHQAQPIIFILECSHKAFLSRCIGLCLIREPIIFILEAGNTESGEEAALWLHFLHKIQVQKIQMYWLCLMEKRQAIQNLERNKCSLYGCTLHKPIIFNTSEP